VCQRPRAEISDAAEIITDAVALPGPAGPGGHLLSPARFRVERYDKGAGPRVIEALTGGRFAGDGVYAWLSDSLHVRAGERWRLIGARDERGCFVSDCAASQRLPDAVLAPMARRRGRWVEVVRSHFSGPARRRLPRLPAIGIARLAIRDEDAAPVARLGSHVLRARRKHRTGTSCAYRAEGLPADRGRGPLGVLDGGGSADGRP
jgi:hypothetical protein